MTLLAFSQGQHMAKMRFFGWATLSPLMSLCVSQWLRHKNCQRLPGVQRVVAVAEAHCL